MATRTYKNSSDFDAEQPHFTIETVGERYYLKIGALSSADQRLVESLIPDGYVGFFQDDERISIAAIVSTYDSENARIEIKDLTAGLTAEAEYVIRFTQARPGDPGDGEGGEDGEHAEIEIEDTDTGVRVRGKSGGETEFGPWFDVNDGLDGDDGESGEHAEIEIEDTPPDNENAPGIRVRGRSGGEADFGEWHYVQDGEDGEDGQPANDGDDGDDGWSPKFATVSDGERRVLQVVDWFGGSGTKPDTGQYVGADGLIDDIADGVDIRGPRGIGTPGDDGGPGDDGEDGWSPVFAIEPDGVRRVLRVIDWIGGTGDKPAIGKYVGVTGFVDNIEDAVDIRGPAGRDGRDGTDGVADVQLTKGYFTPQLWRVMYENASNDRWEGGGGSDPNRLSISSATGRWTRHRGTNIDIVHFFMCFKFVVNSTNLPQGVKSIRGWISPNPHGESIIAGTHGVGTPMGPNQSGGGWFPVTIQAGDRDSTIVNDLPNEGSKRNAIRVEVLDSDNQGNTFDALLAITGVYDVSS